jgi:hypothetical protein
LTKTSREKLVYRTMSTAVAETVTKIGIILLMSYRAVTIPSTQKGGEVEQMSSCEVDGEPTEPNDGPGWRD